MRDSSDIVGVNVDANVSCVFHDLSLPLIDMLVS